MVGFSNIADISAKLLQFWGGNQASGNTLTSTGEGRTPTFESPGGVGNATYGRIDLNTQELTIAAVNTSVPMTDGGAISGTTSNVTIDTTLGTITVNFNAPRLCEISSSIRLQPATGVGSITIRFEIQVNGTTVKFMQRGAVPLLVGANFQLSHVQVLNPGDVVRLAAQNRTDDEDIESLGDFDFIDSDVTTGEITFPAQGFFVVAGIG